MSTAANGDEKIYRFVHTALFTVRIAKGILETARLLERGKAKTVIVAANVSPPARLDIVRGLCREKGVPILTVSDRSRLGESAGLEVGASCIALPIVMQ